MKFRIRFNIDWRRLLLLYWLVVAYLMLVASITRAAPLSEADKERERVRVAIEIARARLHPKPVPVVVPTPEVVVVSRFTDTGPGIVALPPVAPVRSIGLQDGTAMERTRTFATFAGQSGYIVRGCVSYG